MGEELLRRVDHLDWFDEWTEEMLEEAAAEVAARQKVIIPGQVDFKEEADLVVASVKSEDPELARQTVSQLSLAVLSWAGDYRMEQLKEERDHLKGDIQLTEARIENYEPDLDDYYEELAHEKEALESSLELVEENIEEIQARYSGIDWEHRVIALEGDATLNALMSRQGYLLNSLTEIELEMHRIEQGQLSREIKMEDPYYCFLMEEKENLEQQKNKLVYDLEKAEYYLEDLDTDRYVYTEPASDSPVNMRWPLNTAVAGVLGLMLSVFIVFVRPHFSELKEELKNSNQNEKE